MKHKLALPLLALLCVSSVFAQHKDFELPAMHAARGTRGALASGSEYADEAGMRMFFHGGNAVDAGVASMYAAAVA
jgi:gamma-glutamyltranspeptidase/glutathione hydrolase